MARAPCATCPNFQEVWKWRNATYTNEEFEAKAQELMHMVFTISEERIFMAPRLRSPVENALAEGAMTLNYALRAFLAVSRMQGK